MPARARGFQKPWPAAIRILGELAGEILEGEQIRKAEETLERGKWADFGKAMENLKKTLLPEPKEDSSG